MKPSYEALLLVVLFSLCYSQECDVVVTSPTTLKKELKAMLNNFEVNFDDNMQ
jgi:hypothetical protein